MELAAGYLDFFQPDVFVETRPGLASACGLSTDAKWAAERSVTNLEEFVNERDGRGPEFAFGLSIFDVYKHLYKTQYQFTSRHKKHVTLIEGRTKDSLFLDALAGSFPSLESLKYIRQGFLDAFDAKIEKPTPECLLEVVRQDSITPIEITRHGIEEDHLGGYSSDPTIFILDPASSLDILDFWNLRLFKPGVFPFSIHWLKHLRSFLREFVEWNHRPLPMNRNGVMISTTMEVGRSLDFDVVNKTLDGVLEGLPQGSSSRKQWYDPIWERPSSDHVFHSARIELESESVELELTVDDQKKEASIRFKSISPAFATKYGGLSARWVNVLSLSNFARENEYALVLPSSFEKLNVGRMRVGELFSVTREGFILPQHFKDHREWLRLLQGREALVAWLAAQGVVASASESGRIADQVLSAVGGFWGSHLLADRDTLELLNTMSKSTRTFERSNTVDEYEGRTVAADRWLAVIGKRTKRLGTTTSIESYVDAGALKLGLSITCPECEKLNWYGLKELDERVECERCLKVFKFPQGSLNFVRTPWRFRVAGPFTVPDYANGAYSTVLALRCLARNLGSSNRSALSYSTSLDVEVDGKKFEVDFAGWYQRELRYRVFDEPTLIIGESKSFGTEVVHAKDLTRLKSLAMKLPGAVIVIAVLKDSLSESEKERLATFATWGRERSPDGRQRAPVVVLTGTELFADYSVEEAWREKGGKWKELVEPHRVWLDNLLTLADLTQRVYLDMPSYWTWYEEKYRRRHERRADAK